MKMIVKFVLLMWVAYSLFLPLCFAQNITCTVINVSETDSLNIRHKSNSGSQIVGKIPFNAENIRLISDNDRSGWYKIKYKNHIGWVNSYFLKTNTEKSFCEPLDCLGNEPYWSMQLHGDQIIFSNPRDQKRIFRVSKIQQSLNNTNQWYIEGVASDKNAHVKKISVYIIKQHCSDDMSDSSYKYRILVHDSEKNQTINGCCNVIE